MVLYTAIALITIFVALFVRNREYIYGNTRQRMLNRISIAAVFCILFLLSALRIEVGNDYITYVQNAHEIYVGGITVTEPGYNLIVKLLFMLSGYENYLLVFAFFGFVTIFVFLKAIYDQSESFAMSFMLFMALGIYFRSFTTVRYYLVLAVTLYSLRYVLKKQYIAFVLIIAISALFHKSVLIVIPLFIICSLPWKKWFYAIIALVTVGIYVMKDFVMDIALRLYPSYRDTIYLTQDTGIMESIPALLRCAFVLAMCLICYKDSIKENNQNTLYFKMTIIAVAIYTGGSFLPMVSRFGYYMITPQILLIPGIYKNVSDEKKKRYLFYAIMVFSLMYFVYFLFTASKSGIAVLPYRSWLFNELEWNNIEEMLMYNNR